MTERWLLTGSTGQVGSLLKQKAPQGVQVLSPRRDVLDLEDIPEILPSDIASFDLIINCGAFTNVDMAEKEKERAYAINCIAPRKLAAIAAERGVPIIHLSTDYVFDGSGHMPLREIDQTNPINYYGVTKLAGEQAVVSSGADYCIVRTSWVVSSVGKNFVKTMMRLAAGESVSVVSDQIGSPTNASDLADAILHILQRTRDQRLFESEIYNFANRGYASWLDVAKHVFQSMTKHGLKVPKNVRDVLSADYDSLAQRPLNSRLDCSKFDHAFEFRRRHWALAIEDIVNVLIQEEFN